MLGIEKLERLVVRLFVEQHRGEAQPREVAQIVRRRMLHDPLQLRLRRLHVVAVEVVARGHERAHRRIEGARIAFHQRAGGIAQRLGVVRLRGLRQGLVQRACLRRLARLNARRGSPIQCSP